MGGVLIAYVGTVDPPASNRQLPPSGPRTFGVPDELIVRMQQGGRVRIFIVCNDANQLPSIVHRLGEVARGLELPFDPALVHLVPWDADTYWTRDYGPWWVECTDDGTLGIAKHVYTSLGSGSVGMVEGNEDLAATTLGGIFRPNDSCAADEFSDFLDTPIRAWNLAGQQPALAPHHWYFTGLLDVGGNYMVTGDGLIASSYLVARQNEVPGDDTIEARMRYVMHQANRFLGAEQYLAFTDPSGTYIGHIDCWAKFLGPRTVVVARSSQPAIDQAYDEIAERFTALGFETFRILCQPVYIPGRVGQTTTAAYCNSLILNDEVYVPLAGASYAAHDEAALAVYREAMPDHRIVGILGKPGHPWLGTDALHCRTRGVPKSAVDNWAASLGLAPPPA